MAQISVRTLAITTLGTAVVVAGIVGGGLFIALSPGQDTGREQVDGEQSATLQERGDAATEAEPPGPPLYKEVQPAVLVNFDSDTGPEYLQVKIQLMARASSVLERAEQHMPAIRNDLILLLSEQDPESLRSRAGKDALREDVLAAVRDIIDEGREPGSPTIEQIYFTNFVMQ